MEPVIITTPDEPEGDEETVLVFRIDGTDYHMPAEPPGNVALNYAEIAGTEGELAAQSWLFREMLGDGYDVLLGCKHVTKGDIERIGQQVAEVALAAGEGQQGNRAARRTKQRAAGRGSSTTSTTSTRTSGPSTGSRSRKRSTS